MSESKPEKLLHSLISVPIYCSSCSFGLLLAEKTVFCSSSSPFLTRCWFLLFLLLCCKLISIEFNPWLAFTSLHRRRLNLSFRSLSRSCFFARSFLLSFIISLPPPVLEWILSKSGALETELEEDPRDHLPFVNLKRA